MYIENLFDNELFSDIEVKFYSGSSLKCHKFVLRKHSKIFKKLINDTSGPTDKKKKLFI